jgi:hypothetical protein
MTTIKTYRQARPADYLKAHPTERWRCDIFPDDGSDHHGIGATEASAVANAALHWEAYRTRPLSDQIGQRSADLKQLAEGIKP